MVARDDWRWNGQERFLTGARFRFEAFVPVSVSWDHEHCQMCGDKISTAAGDIHTAYRSIIGRHWVCANCFRDFADALQWSTEA